jgi:hypothetical protein
VIGADDRRNPYALTALGERRFALFAAVAATGTARNFSPC